MVTRDRTGRFLGQAVAYPLCVAKWRATDAGLHFCNLGSMANEVVTSVRVHFSPFQLGKVRTLVWISARRAKSEVQNGAV